VPDQVLALTPLLAGVCAVPQFIPQLRIAFISEDISGVSWAWAALTSVNNGVWCSYFVLSHYWTALVPGAAVTIVAGALAVQLARRRKSTRAGTVLIGAWIAITAIVGIGLGRAPLGAVLTGAFVLQVTPSLWTAYRTRDPAGISRGTWLLILAELCCWGLYGIRSSDPRLIVLGALGVTASILMLMRSSRRPAHAGRRDEPKGDKPCNQAMPAQGSRLTTPG
jgi:uncharacterized protein with PQ loop repeat